MVIVIYFYLKKKKGSDGSTREPDGFDPSNPKNKRIINGVTRL
jgi:hypothetical protein